MLGLGELDKLVVDPYEPVDLLNFGLNYGDLIWRVIRRFLPEWFLEHTGLCSVGRVGTSNDYSPVKLSE